MTTDDMDVHGSATATRAVPRAARRRRAPDEGAPGWSSSELARAETALRQLGRRDCVGDTDGLDELLAGATQQLLAADDEIRVQRAALRGLASETAATVHRRSRAGASPPVPGHSTHPGQSEPAALDVVVAAERAPDLLTWTVPDAGSVERGDTALARGLAEMCGVASSRGGRHEVLVALARAASVGVQAPGRRR
ncbi:hypothetical protein [Cellulomonas alba]|uniref:DUF222 domain-containing protein n=1 Tax=Cellulomonas alba TaxID=3053467 RepID=A0ABT7SE15_9CELL|nr:hypothetical protein [Cellulomonas alba]MDM7853832.1 hypothetical protein [Cellulomonas alba]